MPRIEAPPDSAAPATRGATPAATSGPLTAPSTAPRTAPRTASLDVPLTALPPAPTLAPVDEEHVVAIVRQLALELGGARAACAVTPTASLDRDVGLGSLERVELLTRLEAASGRDLGDRFLLMDSAREIADALPSAPPATVAARSARPAAAAASTVDVERVATLTEALWLHADAEPGRVHVHLHTDTAVTLLGYGALRDGAARIAASLVRRGVKRGDTVAIMLPTGIEFLQSFMGVLAAGGIAVPLYPPWRLDRMAEYLQRQTRILANANARHLVAMREAIPVARLLRGALATRTTIVTAEELRGECDPLAKPIYIRGGDPALIQYTSGSTGDPKGVLLTHDNLLANIRAIAEAIALRDGDVGVSWLPLYHDMGLIGTWLCTMVRGIPIALMPPLAFLARPERWLWAIHEHRATVSPAPNFAYELCVRKIPDAALAGLDLSCWRSAFNGSEPVSADTLERFARRFAPYGFRREALTPVYGLAESSVALTVPPTGRGPLVDRIAREPFVREGRAVPAAAGDRTAMRFVSVGRALPGHEVRLVDDAGGRVPERVVGRLEFRGPSCMRAYHANPEATRRTVRPDGWLDSGDLAYEAAGELFITGRVKDLVIKGGRNLVPQEVEEVAGGVPGIRRGCVAAFGVPDESTGTERLVVVAESRAQTMAERRRLEGDVVARVGEAVGLPPDAVLVVAPGAVPKTPSGKIRRGAARAAYMAGELGHRRAMPLRLRAALLASAAGRLFRAAAARVGRALYVAWLVVGWTIAVVVLVPVLWLVARLSPPGGRVRRLTRFACRTALRITGCRVRVEGSERVPRVGPVVFVANHTSYADAPTLVAMLPRDFVFVAMEEILSWPVIGGFVRRGQHPTVDRWHPRRGVADAAAIEARLTSGAAVLFFPEGGFGAASGLRPMRLGAFQAAARSRAAVVPVALSGSRRVLPAGARLPHPGRIDLWIGEPLRTEGADWVAVLSLRDRAADAIAAHCGEPRLDRAPAAHAAEEASP